MLFGRGKKAEQGAKKTYDREKLVPVIRKSICTAERSAGFRHLSDGHFEDVMLIRDDRDLREFMEMYGIEEVPETFY